jgi:hypothetical protein
VSLSDARELRNEKRKLIAKGIDPSAKRKAEKATRTDRAENSFVVIAREFLVKFIDSLSKSHSKRVYARFENDVFPQIGARPIAEITAQELLKAAAPKAQNMTCRWTKYKYYVDEEAKRKNTAKAWVRARVVHHRALRIVDLELEPLRSEAGDLFSEATRSNTQRNGAGHMTCPAPPFRSSNCASSLVDGAGHSVE